MNHAETPIYIQEFAPAHADSWIHGMGAASVAVCPECAFLREGSCEWCPDQTSPDFPSDRPECLSCIGTFKQRPPWFRRTEIMVPLITTIAVTTLATLASAVLLRRAGLR